MVFGWTQILMDLQPLVAILSGHGQLHGFSHTYAGATLIALFSGVTGKYLSELGFSMLLYKRPMAIKIAWWVAILSAFIGSYSHVALDSILYSDISPLFPFSSANGLLGLIPVESVFQLCTYSGFVGAAIYVVVQYVISRQKIE